MLSIQEVLDKTIKSRAGVRKALDNTNSDRGWHPKDGSIYDGLKPSDHYAVRETMNSLSLAEVLMYGSSAQGADDLVSDKLHDTLIYASKQYDLCPLIGRVVGPWAGSGKVDVGIAVDGYYEPYAFRSGGKMNESNVKLVQATLDCQGYGIPILAGSDLVDDSQYDIVQWHVEQAAKACGKKATDLALTVLKAAADGDGTGNAEAAGADTTALLDILNAIEANERDEHDSNTMLITREAWTDAVYTGEFAGGAAGDFNTNYTQWKQPAEGFDFVYHGMDTKFCSARPLHAAIATDIEGGAFTNCVTLVFDRNNALMTGRKRWLEIKDYADPIADIAGAVVSFRQDSVTLYNDSICVITET